VVDSGVAQYRRGTRYSVSFPNLPSLVKQPSHINLVQKQYHHDVLTLKFLMVSEYWVTVLKTGEPVKFTWSNGKSDNEWYGYVNLITKENVAQRKQEMEIQCIGSSFPLKEQVSRAFSFKTIPEVAAIIAKENGLRFVGENHQRRFDDLFIYNQSYWEWLVTNAKKIGYGITLKGLDLHFRPLDKLIDQSMQDVPILASYGTQLPTNSLYFDRNLDYFKVFSGDHVELGTAIRANKQVGGVDPITGKAFVATSNPKDVGIALRSDLSDVIFTEHHSEQVVNDVQSAELTAQGLASLARFSIPAKVKCQGDGRIRPFSPVYIQGTGDSTNGYWVVKEVIHRFALIGDYQIEMTVLSDGLGKDNTTDVRKDVVGVVGTVNVEEALSGKTAVTQSVSVVLDNPSPVYSELNHGFLKTPARWKSLGSELIGV